MKKFFAMLLTGVLVLAVSVPVFADGNATDKTESVPSDANGSSTFTSGTSQGDVVVKITDGNTVTKVYKVDVVWGTLDFTYDFTVDGTPTWDVTNHKYDAASGDESEHWDKTSDKITVKNHSNAAVAVSASFTTESGVSASVTTNGVTATLSNNTATISTAEGTVPNSAPSQEITVGVSGIPTTTSEFTVDTITVTISPSAT
jgi:hypothetical protein